MQTPNIWVISPPHQPHTMLTVAFYPSRPAPAVSNDDIHLAMCAVCLRTLLYLTGGFE